MNRCARDAAALAKFKVYLVAHSMGGLICRTYLQNVTRDDTEHYVDKVCTYATPHGGIEMRGLNVPDIGALDKIQGRPGNRDVWIFEVESETLRPLARSDGDDESPIWSPDGGRVVYTWGRGEQANLHARTPGGDGAADGRPTGACWRSPAGPSIRRRDRSRWMSGS